MLPSLFSLFYVTGEFHRFLYQGRARKRLNWRSWFAEVRRTEVSRKLDSTAMKTFFGKILKVST